MVERVSSRAGKDKTDAVDAASPLAAKRKPAKPVARAGYSKKTIALVYDFDGTLSPRPMQEYSFLPQLGIPAAEFWDECTRVARTENADPLITYMHLMYKKAKDKGLRIDRDALVKQGRSVELYPGVEKWFDAIHAYVKRQGSARDEGRDSTDDEITVKHYLVSSGLTEIIEGTKIYKHFANVFASEYWFDAYDLPFPKRVITDTGKTQYLFRINKGIENHFESINAHMPETARPIPFANMIYFGDGETDVPSMALLKKNGGSAIAVHDPAAGENAGVLAQSPSPGRGGVRGGVNGHDESRSSAASRAAHSGQQKCIELFRAGRCDFYAGADYRKGSDLWKRTALLLDSIIANIRVRQEAAGLG